MDEKLKIEDGSAANQILYPKWPSNYDLAREIARALLMLKAQELESGNNQVLIVIGKTHDDLMEIAQVIRNLQDTI